LTRAFEEAEERRSPEERAGSGDEDRLVRAALDGHGPDGGFVGAKEGGAAGSLGDGLADAALGDIGDPLGMRDPDGPEDLPLIERRDTPAEGDGGALEEPHGLRREGQIAAGSCAPV
jgi:hypothetical protein